MFSYESGIVVAFILWLATVVILVVSINSKLEKNLNRIGQRLSWLTLTPKAKGADEQGRSVVWKLLKFLLIVGIGLPFVLTSWLYVALIVGTFAYKRLKDSGVPQEVREFRWKMKNIDLTFDQLVKELMKIGGEDPANFQTFRESLVRGLDERGVSYG